MGCKCGGSRGNTNREYPVYTVTAVAEGSDILIGAKSSIMLEGLSSDKILLNVGRTLKVDKAAAIDLQKQDAPIWIIN